jgi:hypothetical protein
MDQSIAGVRPERPEKNEDFRDESGKARQSHGGKKSDEYDREVGRHPGR